MPRHRKTKREPVIFRKTKLCKFFSEGVCLRGAQCMWAHGEEELNTLPNFFRTQLCQAFMAKGVCKLAECTFAHSREELRQATAGSGDDTSPLEGDQACGPNSFPISDASKDQTITYSTLKDVNLPDGPTVHRKISVASRVSIESNVSTYLDPNCSAFSSLDNGFRHDVSGYSQEADSFFSLRREAPSSEERHSSSDDHKDSDEDEAMNYAIMSECLRLPGSSAQIKKLTSALVMANLQDSRRQDSQVRDSPCALPEVASDEDDWTGFFERNSLLSAFVGSPEAPSGVTDDSHWMQAADPAVSTPIPWIHHGPTGLDIRVRNTFMEFASGSEAGTELAPVKGRRASIF